MARVLRLIGAGVERPDERHVPVGQRRGARITVRVVSEDLKHKPVHTIDMTEHEAVRLAAQLLQATIHLRGSTV